jgi:hypothetical protein
LVISGLYLCFGWFVCLFLFGDIWEIFTHNFVML